MGNKFKTKSEYYKSQMDMVKSIVAEYDRKIKENNLNETELSELIDRKNFITRLNITNEERYLQYKVNDEPYYESNTYEYYKDIFTNENIQISDYRVISEIELLINDDDLKPTQKVKSIKNVLKAYKETKNKFTIE